MKHTDEGFQFFDEVVTDNTQPDFSAFTGFMEGVISDHDPRMDFDALKGKVEAEAVKHPDIAGAAYWLGMKKNLNSVVMVISCDNISQSAQDADYVILRSEPLLRRRVTRMDDPKFKICPNMPFAGQLSVYMIGTGFFIKDSIVATAAHVLLSGEQDYTKLRFVQGVEISAVNKFPNQIEVHKSQIFEPSKQSDRPGTNCYYYSRMSADWALVSVKPAYPEFTRSITSVTLPDPQFYKNFVHTGNLVYSIGHGLGLPMKVSCNGKIIRTDNANYFECDLDLLCGNSGSPVFDAQTHQLIGIYVRGTEKLKTGDCGNQGQSLIIDKSQGNEYEGQECQRLEPLFVPLRSNVC
jgi:V8-like Glu-specific endopeptidase